MKKGFTLIELLAVILILGIIALIATPIVNKLVKKSKEGAFKSSVENIVQKIEDECQTQLLKGESLTTSYTFSGGVVTPSLDVKGKFPLSGTISVDNDCKTTVDVSNGTLTFTKTKDGELTTTTGDSGSLNDKVDDLIDNSSTYEYMGGTYLKGMQDFNYLWYSGNLYRIMGYDENNNVRLISEGSITTIPYYQNTSSIFSSSYLKDWLNTYFYNHIDNSILKNTSYCTDLTTNVSSSRMICTNSITDTKVTTISLDEYRLAAEPTEYACNDIGLRLYQWDRDNTATQTDFQTYLPGAATTCMGYVEGVVDTSYGMAATYDDANEKVSINLSYLDDSNYDHYWTLTPYNNSGAWRIGGYGNAGGYGLGELFGVRPVITISSNITITGGNGTLTSPIMIEEVKEKSGKSIDNAKSGEYVTLENNLYRVVDKIDGTGTKLILDGYLTTNYTQTNMLTKMGNNTYLTDLGLTSGDSRLVNYTWDRGNYFDYGNSYTISLASSSNTFQSKVGAIRIGEMYSSQSKSIALEKRVYYWTLTPYNSYSAWGVSSNGGASNNGVSCEYGVRPVIMISPDVTITGGNGTLESPYGI